MDAAAPPSARPASARRRACAGASDASARTPAPRRAALDAVDGVDRGRRSCAPGAAAGAIEPLTVPAARDLLRARVGDPVAAGAPRRAPGGADRRRAQRGARPGVDAASAERVALGLLGDLLGHDERDCSPRPGWRCSAGELGVWLVGEQGAFLVRPRRAAGGLLVRAGRRGGGAAGRRPGRAPAAGAARGRGGLRDGREPGLLGPALDGCGGGCRSARGRRSTRRASWSPPSSSAAVAAVAQNGQISPPRSSNCASGSQATSQALPSGSAK